MKALSFEEQFPHDLVRWQEWGSLFPVKHYVVEDARITGENRLQT